MNAGRLRRRLEGDELARRLLWILDSQQEGIVVSDADHRVIEVNATAERMLGAAAEQLIGTGPRDPLWRAVRDPEGRPVPAHELPPQRALRTGEPVQALLRFGDGWFRLEAQCSPPVDGDEGDPVCVSVFVDVTAEIVAREEAADARRHVERIAEAIDRALYTVEVREDGTTPLRYASRGFDRLLGDGHAGGSFEDFWPNVHPGDIRKVQRAAASLRRGERVDYVHRILDAEGRTRWVRARAIPWEGADGRRYVDGVLADVTAEQLARARLQASEAAHRSLAAEQSAIGRLSTEIARGASPATVFQAIADEIATLFKVPAAFVAEFQDDERAVMRGMRPQGAGTEFRVGIPFPTGPGTVGAIIRATGAAARIELPAGRAPLRIGAPIVLGDVLWGYLGIGAFPDAELPDDIHARLQAFAELVATAVASAASRERLEEQANTDPLTHLTNHRAFQLRLRREVARAHRYRRPLALVLVDLDHFKQINDALGHQAGDEVLRTLARTLTAVARDSDTVGRLGGDEFAMLLPETDAAGGHQLAERAREALRAHDIEHRGLTISAGVAELPEDADADRLLRMADGALYSAKEGGRDTVRVYRPDEGLEATPQERIERLVRSQALTALRALARVVDLKDPATRRHSERVADLAEALARATGWPDDRAALLHQAGLLHDVGKVAVPDAVLFKPGALAPEEYEEIKRHAEVGAAIVAEALTDEQVEWIRHHHERPDGGGYPDGLRDGEIPDGALLLAIADAWDVMTSARSYKHAKGPDAALEECRRLSGAQFDPGAVRALERIRAPEAPSG